MQPNFDLNLCFRWNWWFFFTKPLVRSMAFMNQWLSNTRPDIQSCRKIIIYLKKFNCSKFDRTKIAYVRLKLQKTTFIGIPSNVFFSPEKNALFEMHIMQKKKKTKCLIVNIMIVLHLFCCWILHSSFMSEKFVFVCVFFFSGLTRRENRKKKKLVIKCAK